MKHELGDIFAALFLLAIIFIMVRPKSLASNFISATGAGLQAIVTFAVSG